MYSLVVIQTTEGRKNLGNIKWLLSRFFAFAQNDTIYFLESRKNYTFAP